MKTVSIKLPVVACGYQGAYLSSERIVLPADASAEEIAREAGRYLRRAALAEARAAFQDKPRDTVVTRIDARNMRARMAAMFRFAVQHGTDVRGVISPRGEASDSLKYCIGFGINPGEHIGQYYWSDSRHPQDARTVCVLKSLASGFRLREDYWRGGVRVAPIAGQEIDLDMLLYLGGISEKRLLRCKQLGARITGVSDDPYCPQIKITFAQDGFAGKESATLTRELRAAYNAALASMTERVRKN